MQKRTIVIGAAGALVAAAAVTGWFVLGAERSAVRPGAGPYDQQLTECQDRIWGDQMHIAELAFTPNTVWHEVVKQDVKIGGKFTMPGARGPKTTHAYECMLRGTRVITTSIQ